LKRIDFDLQSNSVGIHPNNISNSNNLISDISTFNPSNGNTSRVKPEYAQINDDYTSTSKDIIRKINPVVIPRVSSLASMALCERAAYNISFFGMESDNYTADGVIGNAIHRIILRSTMEITQSLKGNNNSNVVINKSKAKEAFFQNAERDVKINWKHFMLSNVENPLPTIQDDLEIRADRLIDQLFDEQKEHKQILLRPHSIFPLINQNYFSTPCRHNNLNICFLI
jgi:hypothetical protein